jgi:hypothetical protein
MAPNPYRLSSSRHLRQPGTAAVDEQDSLNLRPQRGFQTPEQPAPQQAERLPDHQVLRCGRHPQRPAARLSASSTSQEAGLPEHIGLVAANADTRLQAERGWVEIPRRVGPPTAARRVCGGTSVGRMFETPRTLVVKRRLCRSARQCVDVGPIIRSGQKAGCGGRGILSRLSPSLSRNGRNRDRHDAAQAYAAKLAGAHARNHSHTLR